MGVGGGAARGRSIAEAAAWGSVVVIAGSLLFRLVHAPRVEAIFNAALSCGIGFLFGRITIRQGGDDGFSAMAVGGALAAVAIAWLASMAVVLPDGGIVEFVLNPSGLFAGLVFGGLGGLVYASRF